MDELVLFERLAYLGTMLLITCILLVTFLIKNNYHGANLKVYQTTYIVDLKI